MSTLGEHWTRVFKETARLYFAPLVGAVRGIREEYARIERETAARRARESGDRQIPI